VRPTKGLRIGTKGRAAPGFGRLRVADGVASGASQQARSTRSGGLLVTYADRTLTCVDCGSEFIHSADDQQYYADKGFASDPKRCVSCRASRRAARDTGYSASDLGGPRGYERSAPTREYFAVLCSECGNQAQVPFRPRMDRPVYCSDCFRKAHPD
jgi:CxxC-x17-CxxC domain-containing protein